MNRVLKHIWSSKKAEDNQRFAFEQAAGIKLESLPQGPGICGDAVVVQSTNKLFPVQTKIEFKNDKRSRRTGNFYLEFQSSCDSKVTWYQTGAVKAAKEGCYLCLQSGKKNLVLSPEKFLECFKNEKGRCISTSPGCNGNSLNCSTMGKLLKVSVVALYSCFSFTR